MSPVDREERDGEESFERSDVSRNGSAGVDRFEVVMESFICQSVLTCRWVWTAFSAGILQLVNRSITLKSKY